MDGNHLSIGDRVSIGEIKEFWIVSAKTHDWCILTQTKVIEDPTGWWAMDGAARGLVDMEAGRERHTAIDPDGRSWSVAREFGMNGAWVAVRVASFSHKAMERWHRV